ncbi:nicotinamide-nucleotide amidohydrolase family protein [Ectothiorhodospira lacustris]|uniref:CinA family protein n=1 Tax=Ectothiorhodospira lacustris TaxID=2899127 RepID=UPI001EE9838B|nr:CinA family protein [Ectothiorhodospira lacustris]MCG5509484.1 CinA family protein [Ectothiorhodospira lacustris]MCG5521538.1 CinA family protein [Ectothiorhodospira lacustris]
MYARGERLVLAESCTGGWIAKVITDLPGSSAWFDRGFVTYSNAAKIRQLGVDPALIEAFGAVSEQTVTAMAVGALIHSDAQLAIAVSGIAGPGGGTSDKPVGTVWCAWARPGRDVQAGHYLLAGDREAIRRQAVVKALEGASHCF